MHTYTKRIITTLLPISLLGVGISLAYPSCSVQTETQTMEELYENKNQQKTQQVLDAADYYELWTDLAKSTAASHGTPDIGWCLEYSLYLPYLFQDGVTLISNEGSSIKLKDSDSLWKLYKEQMLQIQFLTGLANADYDSDNNALSLTYTGYLRLKALTALTFEQDNEDYQFDKENTIEIVFSFAKCTFDIENITSANDDSWWSQNISIRPPYYGNEIGTISFYNPTIGRIAASGVTEILPIASTANYFGAYK